jgi:hypothetical protein
LSDCNNKPKLRVTQQVEKLKNKGIKFGIMNEKKAYSFLTQSSYFFKLCSYRKNYTKDNISGLYRDLEFAYLVDLSTIDMHLRRFAIRLTLDIEHMLKTKLLADFNISNSDGYDVIDKFLKDTQNEGIKEYLIRQQADAKIGKNYSPNSPILLKYGLDLAIWNFVEIIQFGHMINFCNYFYRKFPNILYNNIKNDLFNVKCLRNASAHNNCILLLSEKNATYQNNTYQFLLQNKINLSYNITALLKNHTINDFITSLLVFNKVCTSINLKHHCFRELKELFVGRILKNKEYYKTNELLVNSYKFVFNVVDFFSSKYPISV